MQGTMDPVPMAPMMLDGKKSVMVCVMLTEVASRSVVADCTSAVCASPAPGLKTTVHKMPNDAASKDETRKATVARKPMPASSFFVKDPMAPMISHITKGTIPIWIRRKKMLPINWMFCMVGPTTRPVTTPATIATTMAAVGLYLNRFDSVES